MTIFHFRIFGAINWPIGTEIRLFAQICLKNTLTYKWHVHITEVILVNARMAEGELVVQFVIKKQRES